MQQTRASLVSAAGLIAIAGFVTWVTMFTYPMFVSALPRSMQGESVKVPWVVCYAGLFVLPVLLPWVVSWGFLRHQRLQVVFLIALCAFVMLWQFAFDPGSLLDKAWRRGL